MKKQNQVFKTLILTLAFSFSVLLANAADRYSVATNNWNSPATWSATSGGAPGASFPVAGDNVIIEGGFIVTITANAGCANLSIANGSTLSVGGFNLIVSGATSVSGTITFTSAAGTKRFTGLSTIAAGGTWNNGSDAPINFRGGITNNSTFTAGTGVYTFNTNNQALTGILSIPDVRVTGITLTNNGTLTVSTSLAGTGGLTQGVNATLNIGGTSAITTLTASNNGNTVNFSGAAQSVNSVSYYNLLISGSGNKTMSGNVSIEGTLTLTAGTFTVGANTLTLNGPTIAGTPSNLTTSASSGLNFGGTSAGVFIPGSVTNLNNLTINNPAGVTLSGNVTVSNTLTMTQGNVITGSFTLSLSNGVASSLVHISGTVIGRVRRAINTTPSSDYLFPVGTVVYYRPAILNFSSLSAGMDITAEFIANSPDGFIAYSDGLVELENTFSEGYWRFSSSGLPAATYNLSLTGNGFISYVIDESSRITGRDNGNSTWRVMGAHGSRSGNDISRTGVTSLNSTSFDFALASGCAKTLLGYEYERNITIDYTKVEGGSDLYNFPILVNLSGQNFLQTSPAGQIFDVNGFDIIFTDDEYNQLDHQLEYYNGTNGDLIAWIRIPTLSSSSNTVIKVLYGNPQITSDPSVTSVWDSHYKGVWHLDNNSLDDFTSFNKAGTPYNSPTYPAGKINNSLGLNGTNQYVEVINDTNINFAGNLTVSAWVYMNAGGRDQKIAGNQNNSSGGYKFGIYTNNKVEFEIRNSANTPSLNRNVSGGTVLVTGQWYYLAGISSDVLDSIKTFVNGVPERPFKKIGILGKASDKLTISKEPFQPSYYFSGRFDELRISDEVRSNGWMRTEYNNQESPSTFYDLDAAGVISGNLPSESICIGPITLTFGFPAGGVYSGNPDIAGDIFTPPSPGTYPITYTYIGDCGPTSITKNFIITDIPPVPVAPDKEYCIDQIALLEATSGENIRWYSGGTLVSTANPYSTGQTAAGTYNYTVTQTLNGCESEPAAVSLTLYDGITINTQPQPTTICEDGNATFTVAVTGYNLTYRWQEDGVNITDDGTYAGATTSTLILTNPGITKDGKLYRCVVSSSCGASPVNSAEALLTITQKPVATFSYTDTPYCPNAADPFPTFSGGGIAGTFSSASGLVFVSTATGQVNVAASTPDNYTVTNTIAASGACGEVSATSPITIISDITWTGAVSTDWNEPGNWTCGFIPVSTTLVQIPDVSNQPVLGTGATGAVKDLVIDNNSSLTVDGDTLRISGTITNSGTLSATTGTIELNGSAAQFIGNNVFAGNTIKDLIINNTAGTTLLGPLNISGTVSILNGTLSSGGYLTLLSTAEQTALIDGSGTGSVTGDVTMQRYLQSGFGYKYFSSPFQAALVGEFGDDMNLEASFPSFYRYDESRTSSGWVSYINPANILEPLHGYAVNFGSSAAANTADVTGIINNGSMSVTLYNNNNTYTKGFNLVGNPYPSPVDWDAPSGWTRINIDDAIYFYNNSTTDQYSGAYNSYENGVSSDGIANNIIPSMQGFFIHVSDGSWPVTGTFGLDNSTRITDKTHPFAKSGEEDEKSIVRLIAGYSDDITSFDPLVIYYDEKATYNFDGQLDALKLYNTDMNVTNFYVFGDDGSRLSIDAIPYTGDSLCTLRLGLKTEKSGNIIFRIKDISGIYLNNTIYLSDVITGINQELNPDRQQYEVNLPAGDYQNRFFINFSNYITDIPKNINDIDWFNVYSSGGILKAEINLPDGEPGMFIIYDLTGRKLFNRKIYSPGYYEFNPKLSNGIYIVSFTSGNKRISKKLFIKG